MEKFICPACGYQCEGERPGICPTCGCPGSAFEVVGGDNEK